MTFDDYLLHLFYLVDTHLKALNLPRLRSRGPAPTLHDSEVICMVLAGEFIGLDSDEGIYRHFCRYHAREFPRLPTLDRSTFARQAANLWRATQLLQERICKLLPAGEEVEGIAPLWIVDSFPLRVCRFRRAPGHKLFHGLGAAYGRDPTDGGRQGRFYGFRVHLRVSDRGTCIAATLAPANLTDLPLVAELAPAEGGIGLGDRNYWSPEAQHQLREQQGVILLAPFRSAKYDPWPRRSKLLSRLRQVIEPVIGQLAVRFRCQMTRARDLWHLTARLSRKLLSHTMALLLNWLHGNLPLELDRLITA